MTRSSKARWFFVFGLLILGILAFVILRSHSSAASLADASTASFREACPEYERGWGRLGPMLDRQDGPKLWWQFVYDADGEEWEHRWLVIYVDVTGSVVETDPQDLFERLEPLQQAVVDSGAACP